MKGLLIKDIGLIFSNLRTLVIFAFVVLMLLFAGDGNNLGFVCGYLSMLCGMMVLSSISYDEFDHSNAFLMTLPVTRKLYAAEKYVFAAIFTLAGDLAALLIGSIYCIIKGVPLDMAETLGIAGAVFAAIFMVLAIMIPFQLKFGSDNGRMVIVGFVLVVLLGGLAVKKLLEFLKVDINALAGNAVTFFSQMGLPVIIAGLVVVYLVLIGLSCHISYQIMKKKEF